MRPFNTGWYPAVPKGCEDWCWSDIWVPFGMFCGDPLARVQPTKVQRKPGAGIVRARSRVYSSKNAWGKGNFERMKTTEMVFSYHQATCSSVAIAVPKESGFRMAAENRTVNPLVEQEAMPTPRREN